jgi:hypothetical protein
MDKKVMGLNFKPQNPHLTVIHRYDEEKAKKGHINRNLFGMIIESQKPPHENGPFVNSTIIVILLAFLQVFIIRYMLVDDLGYAYWYLMYIPSYLSLIISGIYGHLYGIGVNHKPEGNKERIIAFTYVILFTSGLLLSIYALAKIDDPHAKEYGSIILCFLTMFVACLKMGATRFRNKLLQFFRGRAQNNSTHSEELIQ